VFDKFSMSNAMKLENNENKGMDLLYISMGNFSQDTVAVISP
jgi:hypothetical protein